MAKRRWKVRNSLVSWVSLLHEIQCISFVSLLYFYPELSGKAIKNYQLI